MATPDEVLSIEIEAKVGFEEHDLTTFREAGAYAVYQRLADGTAAFIEDFADYSDAVDCARAQGLPEITLVAEDGVTAVDFIPPPEPPDLTDIAEVERWLNS